VHHQRPLRSARVGRRAALILAAGLLCLIGAAGPAAADNTLLTSSPGMGKSVSKAPTELTMTFDDTLVLKDATVWVRGPNGDATSGRPLVDDHDIVQPLLRGLPEGIYRVSWRISGVFFSDSGGFSFEVRDPLSASDATTTAITPSPTAEESPSDRTAGAGQTTTSAPIAGPGSAGDRTSARSAAYRSSALPSPTVLWIGAVTLAAIIAMVGWLFLRDPGE
jgi:methionine-rich copper-binding protein CopC